MSNYFIKLSVTVLYTRGNWRDWKWKYRISKYPNTEVRLPTPSSTFSLDFLYFPTSCTCSFVVVTWVTDISHWDARPPRVCGPRPDTAEEVTSLPFWILHPRHSLICWWMRIGEEFQNRSWQILPSVCDWSLCLRKGYLIYNYSTCILYTSTLSYI